MFDTIPTNFKNRDDVIQWMKMASSNVDQSKVKEYAGLNSIYTSKVMANTLNDSLTAFLDKDKYATVEGIILQDGTSVVTHPSHTIVAEILSAKTLGVTLKEYNMMIPTMFWADMHVLAMNITKALLVYPDFQMTVGNPSNEQMKTLTVLEEKYPDRFSLDIHRYPDLNFPTSFVKDAWYLT